MSTRRTRTGGYTKYPVLWLPGTAGYSLELLPIPEHLNTSTGMAFAINENGQITGRSG